VTAGAAFDPSRPPPYFSTVIVRRDRNGEEGS
jgi:hypothetical protein